GAGGKDDDAALLEMPDGATPNVRFGEFLHPDGGHDPRVDALALEHILNGERVDHRAEHAHVVGGDAVEACFGEERSANDVAATDDESEAGARLRDGDDFVGESADGVEVEAESLFAGECFAREFQEGAWVLQCRLCGGSHPERAERAKDLLCNNRIAVGAPRT